MKTKKTYSEENKGIGADIIKLILLILCVTGAFVAATVIGNWNEKESIEWQYEPKL